jgi:hypothetical protein
MSLIFRQCASFYLLKYNFLMAKYQILCVLLVPRKLILLQRYGQGIQTSHNWHNEHIGTLQQITKD